MEFLSLSRKRSSARNVPAAKSAEKRMFSQANAQGTRTRCDLERLPYSLIILYICVSTFYSFSRFGQVFSRKIIKMLNYKDFSHKSICYVWELRQSSRESSRPSKRTIEQGTVLRGFRNKSYLTKRRDLYRMLSICEKANRIYRVI